MLEETIQKIEAAIQGVEIEVALKALAEVDRKVRASNSSSGTLEGFQPMNAVA